jgi:hypothetical protein
MMTRQRDHIRRVSWLRPVPSCSGQGQLRPALAGWQYRISIEGRVWGPWGFAFGRRERALARLERLRPIWIEELIR